MTYPEQMRRGATFYREVALFSDKEKTIPLDLTGKTPRATLMTLEGTHVADFVCEILGAPEDGKLAWQMPRDSTALIPKGLYITNIDLDDGDTTDEAYSNQMLVLPGQLP